MCGRFAAFSSATAIADQLAIQVISAGARLLPPSWNVAPTNEIALIANADAIQMQLPDPLAEGYPNTNTKQLELTTARWGLMPQWSKPPKGRSSGIINARAESVAQKRPFKDAFNKRRCLVPVDGYYEWQKLQAGHTKKQPWYFTNSDGTLMLFAGIFDVTSDGLSVAITTMPANETMAPIHHRMPTVLSAADIDTWLYADAETAERLILTAPQHLTRAKVSSRVNSVANNGPSLISEISDPISEMINNRAELTLF